MAQPTLSLAAALAAFGSGTLTAGTRIADTADAIAGQLDALRPLALSGRLAGIDLRDAVEPVIATTPSEAAANAAVLGLIAGRYALQQSVSASEAPGATLAAGFTALAIADSAAQVAARLADIQALWRAGRLGRVTLVDATPPTLALTAAQLADGIDALQAIPGATAFAITLSDAGTPGIMLPVREGRMDAMLGVLARIATPFTPVLPGPVSAADAAAFAAADPSAALPVGIAVLDSAANIAAHLAALEQIAGRIASIELRDGGPALMALTAAQRDSFAQAIAKMATNIQLSQRINAAQAGSAALDPRFASFTIEDSLASIMGNLAAVDALLRTDRVGLLRLTDTTPGLSLSAAELSAAALVLSQASGTARRINLTDGGTPTVNIAADMLGSAAVRERVLNQITGPFRLAVTGAIGVSAAVAIAAAQDTSLASLSGLRVAGHAAEIVANLATLKTLADARKIAAIDLLDGGVVSLGIALTVALANASVLTLISSPRVNAAGTGTSGRMSAANFLLSLATVQSGAIQGSLKQVSLSNSTTAVMSVSAANLSRYLEAFTKLISTSIPLAPYTITLSDAGTPTVSLARWQVSAAAVAVLERVTSGFALTVSGTLGAAAAALLSNSAVAARLTGGIAISDSSANVAAHLTALQALAARGGLSSITLLDGGVVPLVLTPAQAAEAPGVLAAIVSPHQLTRSATAASAAAPAAPFTVVTVTDSAANVQAHLETLQRLVVAGHLDRITVTGGGAIALSLTPAEVAANADALLRISNNFTITLFGAGIPTIRLDNQQVDAGIGRLLARIATPYALAVDGPITAAGASALVAAGSTVVTQIAAGGLVIRDTPMGLHARIADIKSLLAAGAIGAIELSGGTRSLSLDEADGAAGQAMLALIAGPAALSQIIAVGGIATAMLASGFSNFTVSDSAANILAGLAQIQTLAASLRLGRLHFTDAAPELVVSSSSIMAALESWLAQDVAPYPITLAGDTPVLTIPAAVLGQPGFRANILDAITNPSWSVVATGRLSVAAVADIVAEDRPTLAHLGAGLTIAATKREILANLADLSVLARRGLIGAIDMLDPEPRVLSLSDAQAHAHAATLARISGPYRLETPGGTTAVETLASLDGQAFTDFGPTAAIDIRDAPFTPNEMSFAFSGSQLRILQNDTLLATTTVTAAQGVTYSDTSFYVAPDGAGGTTLRANASPIAVTNTRTSTNTVSGGDFYRGAVGYLQRQFINPTGDPVNVAAGIPNVFLHGGGASGGNALQVLSGQNVIDGGIGSNFLVGGAAAEGADTFFLDGRGGGVSWGTVVNFQQGDAVTFWGWQDGVTTYDWFASDGAPGFSGATIHARLGGGSGAYDASITFAGIDLATAQDFVFIRNGAVGDTTYAYIANL